MTHRTFDWRSHHDPRSRDYPIRSLVGIVDPKPRAWDLGPVLDQGSEGACVGFGWTAELLASPRPNFAVDLRVATAYAMSIYRTAQRIDEWPGEDYSGTSVLAGAKVITERGYITGYRWAFGIDDLRDAVVAHGPAVIGIPWYASMYATRASGLIEVDGPKVGGHCILVNGYHPRMRINGEGWLARHEVFRVRNSWGPNWGLSGNGYIKASDLAALLAADGEACIPVGRKRVRL